MNTPESRERRALWLLWITPALWSVNYIVARTAPGVVEPHMLALGRWALAGVILAVIARSELWRERRSTLQQLLGHGQTHAARSACEDVEVLRHGRNTSGMIPFSGCRR